MPTELIVATMRGVIDFNYNEELVNDAAAMAVAVVHTRHRLRNRIHAVARIIFANKVIDSARLSRQMFTNIFPSSV